MCSSHSQPPQGLRVALRRVLQLVACAIAVGIVHAVESTPVGSAASGAPSRGAHVGTLLSLNVPPRRMWGWGPGLSGFCGEMSIQSAGLYYGNYISEQRARDAGGTGSQLLIGVNLEAVSATE